MKTETFAKPVPTASQLGTRTMSARDLPAAYRLSTEAGWNQVADDWELFLACSPQGCFVTVDADKVVGTVTTLPFGPVAWVSMVLVDVEYRRRGIGQLLLQLALSHLVAVDQVKLDATPAGRSLYEKLGFVQEGELCRWVCAHVPKLVSPQGVSPLGPQELKAVIAMDAAAMGATRALLLQSLQQRSPQLAWKSIEAGNQAFALGRPGRHSTQIGPVIGTSEQAARQVVTAALASLAGQAAVLDVPVGQGALTSWLQELGFEAQRPLYRMVKGGTPSPIAEEIFAIAGPELG